MKKRYSQNPAALSKSAALKKLLLTVMFLLVLTPIMAQSSICVPSSPYVDEDGITNVTIGTINNDTGLETNNYGDYSEQVANVGQGVEQMFSITLNTLNAYNVKIWVDWNNNLEFDEDEEVYNGISGRNPNSELRGTLTVPTTTPLGNHRLRIGGKIDWAGVPEPCSTEEYYTVFEDYTINVTTPPSCNTPTNAVGTASAPGSATISWAAPNSSEPSGYEYVVNTSSAIPTDGTVATAATTATVAIENNVFYYLHVRTNCGNGDYSQWITSARFRYTLGDTCTTAINLQTLTSPYTSTTSGANDDYTNSCTDNTAPDIFYAMEVPVGYVFNIQQTDANYDTLHTIFYGDCITGYTLECNGFGNSGIVWENTTSATQTVYWVQYGYENSGAFTLQWSLIPPPACNIPRNVTGTMTSLTTADISWTVPITGTPTEYEYAVTQSEAAPTTGTQITTNLFATGLTTAANALNYVHVRTKCGPNEFSEWVTYTFYSGHCLPDTSFFNYYYIVSFSTANGLNNNISNMTEQVTAYSNNFDTMTVSQLPGRNFSYTLAVDDYTNATIWVDWNNDLDFNDVGERVATHVYEGVNDGYTGTISIPPATAPGNYRMRVRTSDTPLGNPCSTYVYGVAQDYAINVGNPPTCFNPVNVTGTALAPGMASLSWDPENFGTTPQGYEYAVTTSSTPPQAGTATTDDNIPNYSGLTDGTYYYLHVRTNCGNGDFSQWITSLKFRYLEGDTCSSAINLTPLTSPYSSTTVGAADDYTPSCDAPTWAPDLFYYLEVPNGYTLVVQQLDASDYSSNYSIFYGDCIVQTPIECLRSGGFPIYWENLTGAAQNVYWVQDGGRVSAGEFTISWEMLPPVACDKPRNLVASTTSLTNATVSWSLPNTGNPAGYEYAVTTSLTPPESGTYTTTRSGASTTLAPNATNYLHVRSVCDQESTSVWVTLSFISGYCVPANTNEANYITGISTTDATTNFTNTNNGFSAFTDYTNQYSVSTYAGGTFTIIATAPAATGPYLYSVWIDWNNNFEFEESERMINTSHLTSPANLGITVPTQIAQGSYRMRVRNLLTGSPVTSCGSGDGEAEDYTIIIGEAPSCFPPFSVRIAPSDVTTANLSWSAPLLGSAPAGYEYVFSTSSVEPLGNGTATTSIFIFDAEYDPTQSVYLFVRSSCGSGEYSPWATTAILGTDTANLLANSVIVYKENSTINITTGNTLITGVTIYDTRGRKLYNQANVNNTETAITGLQIQQQVVIVEVITAKGKVSKRIVF